MADSPGKRLGAKITVLVFLVLVGGVGWFVAPYVLPVYRWLEVDFQVLAQEAKVPVEKLMREQDVLLRYAPRPPRGEETDPMPWQIIQESNKSTPDWEKTPKGSKVDETKTLVRVSLLSDGTGQPPSATFASEGGIGKDRYFKARGWRLPAGVLGQDRYRPVFLMKVGSMEKLELGKAIMWQGNLKMVDKQGDSGWISDDGDYFKWRHDDFQRRK